MRTDLPAGTVTFVFTDIEGSTKLLHERGEATYAEALAEHRRIIRRAFGAEDGVEVDTQGDAFFFAFPTAPGALRAAVAAREALRAGPIRVRIGVHTGTPRLTDEGYVGGDVHKAARVAASGHGDQIVVSAATAALVDAGELRDLGEHRLKDLSAPERIFQLGDGDFPPLKSLHQTNLPVPATPFLGRDREVAEISALVSRADVRLVTLTGPGGSGKTRLALQGVAAAGDAFPGGIWWVPLAPVRDHTVVLETARTSLGGSGDLAELIGDKRMLLLFDNFEHVIAAAPEVGALLERCPRLIACVTSREPLRLDGEWEYAVDPLRANEAVALFEMRARAARRDFVANGEVAEICSRLDNLPLAIELAAARVKILSPPALLERLERRLPVLTSGARDAPERQQTLRATIEWSHDLLSPEEQILFRRLSVFAGGASFDACERVCDADLDVLASVVDKSLVRQTKDRFWMLETIREYALERLAESGEAEAIRRAHAEFFLRLTEEAAPRLRTEMPGSEGIWLPRFDLERDNLRAAFATFAEAGAEPELARLVAASWRYWGDRGLVLEGRRMAERVRRVASVEPVARANIVAAASHFAVQSGDFSAGVELAEQALSLARRTEDGWLIAEAAWQLGYALVESGRPAAAPPLIAEAIDRFDQAGDVHSALWATRTLAFVHHELEELDVARELHEKNIDRARTLGNRQLEAVTLGALSMVAVDEGRHDEALALLHTNTQIFGELSDLAAITVNLGRVAHALTFIGKAPEAARLLAFVDAQFADQDPPPPWVVRMLDAARERVRSELDDEAYERAARAGRALTPEAAVALALEWTVTASSSPARGRVGDPAHDAPGSEEPTP